MKLLLGQVRFQGCFCRHNRPTKVGYDLGHRKDPISVHARFEGDSERYSNPWGGELREYTPGLFSVHARSSPDSGRFSGARDSGLNGHTEKMWFPYKADDSA